MGVVRAAGAGTAARGGSRPGGGSWQGGGWNGGSWHGGGWNGGSWHGGGWQGGGWNGGGWHGGSPWVWRGGYWGGGGNWGWSGGWWGPNVGLVFGLPAFWGWPFFDLAWSTPSVAFVSQDPALTLIPSPAAPAPVTFWYYCTEPAGYFPYVQSCSRAWIPVLPQSVHALAVGPDAAVTAQLIARRIGR